MFKSENMISMVRESGMEFVPLPLSVINELIPHVRELIKDTPVQDSIKLREYSLALGSMILAREKANG